MMVKDNSVPEEQEYTDSDASIAKLPDNGQQPSGSKELTL